MMGIVHGAMRAVTGAVNTTTAAAGAVGGAAISGIVGGIQGTAAGIRNGLSSGSRSTPAAALTLAAVGAAGLVDWPVLLTVGGTALAVRQLTQRSHTPAAPSRPEPPTLRRVNTKSSAAKTSPAKKSAAKKSPAKKSPAKASKTAPRKSTPTRRPRAKT
jgi:hypothetical protein